MPTAVDSLHYIHANDDADIVVVSYLEVRSNSDASLQ